MVDKSFLGDLARQKKQKQAEIQENKNELLQLNYLEQYWKGYCDGYEKAQEEMNGNKQQ